MKKFNPNWLVVIIIFVGISVLLYALSTNLIRGITKDLDIKLKEYEMLIAENNELRSKIESLTAKEIIVDRATKRLGMIFPKDEIIILNIRKEKLEKVQNE